MATYPDMTMTVGQSTHYTSAPVDGETPPKPQPLDGPITVSADDPAILTMVFGSGDMIGTFTAAKPGTATVTFSATSFGSPITETKKFIVTGVPAVTLGLQFSAPA